MFVHSWHVWVWFISFVALHSSAWDPIWVFECATSNSWLFDTRNKGTHITIERQPKRIPTEKSFFVSALPTCRKPQSPSPVWRYEDIEACDVRARHTRHTRHTYPPRKSWHVLANLHLLRLWHQQVLLHTKQNSKPHSSRSSSSSRSSRVLKVITSVMKRKESKDLGSAEEHAKVSLSHLWESRKSCSKLWLWSLDISAFESNQFHRIVKHPWVSAIDTGLSTKSRKTRTLTCQNQLAKHGETWRNHPTLHELPACPSLWTRLSLKKREANHTSARSARNSATIFTNRPHNPPMWGLKVWPKFPGHHLLWVDAGGRPECRNGPGIAAESVGPKGPKETTQQNLTNPIPKVLKSFRMFQVSSHWISSYRNQTALRSQNKSENGDILAWLKKALAGNVAPARTTTTSATSVGCCTAKKMKRGLTGYDLVLCRAKRKAHKG